MADTLKKSKVIEIRTTNRGCGFEIRRRKKDIKIDYLKGKRSVSDLTKEEFRQFLNIKDREILAQIKKN